MLFNNSISCCYNLFSSPIIEAEFCVFFNQFSTISGWINLLFCLLDWLFPLPPQLPEYLLFESCLGYFCSSSLSWKVGGISLRQVFLVHYVCLSNGDLLFCHFLLLFPSFPFFLFVTSWSLWDSQSGSWIPAFLYSPQ